MAANEFTKPLIAANSKVFVKMTKVMNKKDFLALIEREEKLKEIFQQHKI